MTRKIARVVFSIFTVVGLWGMAGCSHAPVTPVDSRQDPRRLLGFACDAGLKVKDVKGSVWLKAKSKEASGQFPALVKASAPSAVKLEVTNLLGGTEAVIDVDGQTFKVDVPKHPDRNQKGTHSWGGIPLRWAADLFLGKIPCPSDASLKDASYSITGLGELVVETKPSLEQDSERFTYKFRNYAGRAWPESLNWERKGALSTKVNFKFDDPEDVTRSPRKWEAVSPQGEVKVRWKDRQVTS